MTWVALWVVSGSYLVAGSLAQRVNLAAGLWFGEVVIFLGLCALVVRRFGFDPVRLTGLDGVTAKGALFGLASGVVNYAAWAAPLMWVATRLFPPAVVERFDGTAVLRGKGDVELVVIVLGVTLAAPICEEFFFRGVVQSGLARTLGGPRAIVVTALFFAAMHFDPVGFLARFSLGVLFGVLVWRSGSIWPGVLAHAANNATSVALFYASGGGKDEDAPGWIIGVAWAVGNLLLGALAVLSTRRAAWLRSLRPAEASLRAEGATGRSAPTR